MFCFAAVPAAVFARAPVFSDQDRAYLLQVARDTWHSIAELSDSPTGLPYDKSGRPEFTSVSNIGIYLTSISAARQLQIISQQEADTRLERALDSVEQLHTYHGFQQSWNSVVTLHGSTSDVWVSLLDSGNLAAGLLTCAQAEPKFAPRCTKLFQAMDWNFFYDPHRGFLWGGFNTVKSEVNPDWHLDSLATDALMAQFLAVGRGIDPTMFQRLQSAPESRCGFQYLTPGWQGGGLFMQYISGLWLDNDRTLVGHSARSFAAAQIAYAAQKGFPAWGWSACEAPDHKYLGWGAITDQVVTPHACVLAIEEFPAETIANLRALERMGARSPSSGFYDSVDLTTRAHCDNFLILDQGMLFVSLANALDNDVVRRWFGSSEVATSAASALPMYTKG